MGDGREMRATGSAAGSGVSPVAMAQVGVVIALLAVSAQVSVAIGPVPFTLQTLVVALAAMVLTPGQAAAALAGYVLLGALGLPIFSLMRGGIAMIAGPTGGFLYGFILSAFLGSLMRRLIGSSTRARSIAGDVVCAAVVLVVCYVVGTVHLMLVGSMGVAAALGVAVVPFILPDILKCVAAGLVAAALRKAIPSIAAR